MRSSKIILSLLVAVVSLSCKAQVNDKTWQKITHSKDEAWFGTDEAVKMAENVLLYQRNIGGWPKNTQMQNVLSEADKKKLIALKSEPKETTIDNGATTQEMMFLSKVYKQKPDERYKEAFLKGLDYLLEAQYDNGGWPQFFPLKKGYYTHITYNDDAMVNVLKLFKALKDGSDDYSIKPSDAILKKVSIAFDKGIDCIIKTQFKQNGKLTAWCAQHDEVTLQPANARAFELASLSGKESAKITLLLMSIKNPDKQIRDAVEAAVAWFETTQIKGIKLENVTNSDGKKDRVVVDDATAEPLWARFMDLEDNKPFFCDRDGIKKYSLAEIGYERRNGYAWYTNEPKEVLKKYEKWKNSLK